MELNVELLKEQLKGVVAKSDTVLGHVTASLSRAYGLRSLLVIRRDNALVAVTQYCEKVLEKIQSCQEELISLVESHFTFKDEELMKRRESLCVQQQSLQTLYEQANRLLQIGSNMEIGALAPGLIKHLKEIDIDKQQMLTKDDDISVLEFWPGHILTTLESNGIGEVRFEKNKASSAGASESSVAKVRRRCRISLESINAIEKHLKPSEPKQDTSPSSSKSNSSVTANENKQDTGVSVKDGTSGKKPSGSAQDSVPDSKSFTPCVISLKPVEKVCYEPHFQKTVSHKKSRVEKVPEKASVVNPEVEAKKGLPVRLRVAGRGRGLGRKLKTGSGSACAKIGEKEQSIDVNNNAPLKEEASHQIAVWESAQVQQKDQFTNAESEVPKVSVTAASQSQPSAAIYSIPTQLVGEKVASTTKTLNRAAPPLNEMQSSQVHSNHANSFKPSDYKPAAVLLDAKPVLCQALRKPPLFTLGTDSKLGKHSPTTKMPSNLTHSFKPPEMKSGGRWNFIDEEKRPDFGIRPYSVNSWPTARSAFPCVPGSMAAVRGPQNFVFSQPLYPTCFPMASHYYGVPQAGQVLYAPHMQSMSNGSVPHCVKCETPTNDWSRPCCVSSESFFRGIKNEPITPPVTSGSRESEVPTNNLSHPQSVPNTAAEPLSLNIKTEPISPLSDIVKGMELERARSWSGTSDRILSSTVPGQRTSTPEMSERTSKIIRSSLSDSGYPSPCQNLSYVSSIQRSQQQTSSILDRSQPEMNNVFSPVYSRSNDSVLHDFPTDTKSDASGSIDNEIRFLNDKFSPVNQKACHSTYGSNIVKPAVSQPQPVADDSFRMTSLRKSLPDRISSSAPDEEEDWTNETSSTVWKLPKKITVKGKKPQPISVMFQDRCDEGPASVSTTRPARPIPAKGLHICPAGIIHGLRYPIGVTATSDCIIVCETGNNSVNLYMRPYLKSDTPEKIEGFNRPSGVAVDEAKREYYIKDDDAITVFGFGEKRMRRQIGKDDFVKPYGLCLTESGQVVVLDHSYLSLLSYPKEGGCCTKTPIVLPTVRSSIPGVRSMCRFLAACKDFFVVSDLGQNNVYLVNDNGSVFKVFKSHNKYGNADGEFNEPAGITVDKAGHLYIADSRNNRIQVFSSSGDFLCVLPLPYPIRRPSDIHITQDGCLLVCNLHDGSVSIFQVEGEL